MFFAVRPGYDFLFSRKCNLSLSSLKRVCKLELGSNDYVSRRIGKTHQAFFIHDPEQPFLDLIRSVITFDYIKKFLACIVNADYPGISWLVFVYKAYTFDGIGLTEFISAVWHNGISTLI